MSISLHVEDAGDNAKPAIVFLHGAGVSSWMWHTQLSQLSGFHCLAPDLPGHGQSNSMPWVSFDETARLIAELIQQRTPTGRAHIVGLSLGAYVALQLLSHYPQVAERVILSGLTATPLPNQRLAVLMTHLISPLMKTDLMVKFNAKALNIPDHALDRYRTEVKQVAGNTMLDVFVEASQYTMPANAVDIQHPTLIVAGGNEHHLIHNSLEVLADAIPQGKGYLVPEMGHGWVFEAPDLFSQTVSAWCRAETLPASLIDLDELVFA